MEGTQVLVDDGGVPVTLGGAADELVVEVVLRGGGGAEHDVGVGVGREHHVEELGQVLAVGLVIVGFKDVEEVAGLETVAKLLYRLGTDAIDAQQVVLGLADEVANRLDADLAELVGPTLRHAQVVE